MNIRDGFIDTIGATPLIKLRKASADTGCLILGKAEFLNPGGSVKDRAALAIVQDAERKGEIRKGGIIVEGTAGNTGIGLTLVGNARGYRSIIVIPETQTQEKKDTLRACGAELREVPAVPFKDPNNYVHVSRRIAEELRPSAENGVLWANQFDNTANRDGHEATTGPEIWQQTEGKIDAFVSAVGTGGTIAGVGAYLKRQSAKIQIVVADPPGSAIYHYIKTGTPKAEGTSITEGIGQGRVTDNLAGAAIDDAYQIPDSDTVQTVFDLLHFEGLCLGGSSGVNVAGAVRLARDLGPGHTIVTLLCDSGMRYQSRLFNKTFLQSKNLPVPFWLDGSS